MDALSELAEKFHTDKGLKHHGYTPHYHRHLQHLRDEIFVLLELGVGGYEYEDRGGESLRMWDRYFPKAEIHAVDIHKKTMRGRFAIHQGSQDDGTWLTHLVNTIGSPLVIIDDASHINALNIASFNILFPLLKSGGIYICEDIETSYWEKIYGGSTDIYNLLNGSAANYFLSLYHNMNTDKIPLENRPLPTDIASIHLYRGTIIIEKA